MAAAAEASSSAKTVDVESTLSSKDASHGRNIGEVHNVSLKQRVMARKFDKLVYLLDGWLATRKNQMIILLFLGVSQVIGGGFLLALVSSDGNPLEGVWNAWTYVADPGTHAGVEVLGERLVSIMITIGGILFFSVIMGFVVDGIREKMDSLKKGKSQVVETDHILMLGWSDRSVGFIAEVAKSFESDGGGVIVVMSDLEKEVMETEMLEKLSKASLMGTKVVFRSGSVTHMRDLHKASAPTASAICIFADQGDPDKADSLCLRAVLSLMSLKRLKGFVVAEIRDVDNEALVKLVGGDTVETLVSHDILGRLMLTSARQPGLSKVYNSVLGFDGDEFYMREWPQLVGVPFGELQRRFPMAVPIGLKDRRGNIEINPENARVVMSHDQILVIAEDDDTYKPEPLVAVDTGPLPVEDKTPPLQERILICGWRRDLRDMLVLLNSVVGAGSELHIMCEVPITQRNQLLSEGGLDVFSLTNLHFVHYCGNTSVRRHLAPLPLESFNSVMILGDESREQDVMHSDSHSLATLLLIREMQRERKVRLGEEMVGAQMFTNLNRWKQHAKRRVRDDCIMLCEILDSRTRATVMANSSVSAESEFVQSNELVSAILAMIATERGVKVILDELLGAEGTNVVVKSARNYVNRGELLSFYQVAGRVQIKNEILVGYQFQDNISDTAMNPRDKAVAKTWDDLDVVVMTTPGQRFVTADPAASKASNVLSALMDGAERRSFRLQRLSSDVMPRLMSTTSTLSMAGLREDVVAQFLAQTEDLTTANRRLLLHAVLDDEAKRDPRLRGLALMALAVLPSEQTADELKHASSFGVLVGAAASSSTAAMMSGSSLLDGFSSSFLVGEEEEAGEMGAAAAAWGEKSN